MDARVYFCPNCGKIISEFSPKIKNRNYEIPKELVELTLYAGDAKLCAAWPELYPCWVKAFPAVDILRAVAEAHSWEVSNPTRRKVLRSRFLQSWLARAQRDREPKPEPKIEVQPKSLRDRLISQIRDEKYWGRKILDPDCELWEIGPAGLSRNGVTVEYSRLPWDVEKIADLITQLKIVDEGK